MRVLLCWLLVVVQLAPIAAHATDGWEFQIQYEWNERNGNSNSGSGPSQPQGGSRNGDQVSRDVRQSTEEVRSYNGVARSDYERLRARDQFRPSANPRTSSNGSRPSNSPRPKEDANIPLELSQFKSALKEKNPKVYSETLGKDIQFDKSDADDLETLKLYSRIELDKGKRAYKDQRYQELKFANGLLEIKLDTKSSAPEYGVTLYDLAQNIQQNNIQNVVKLFEAMGQSEDFQKGLASSLINNMNPASIFYPMEMNCHSSACDMGSAVGDAVSMALAAMEISAGISAAMGSGGLGLAAATASGGTAAIAAPISIAGVLQGLALAGHGASVFHGALGSMFKKISTPDNLKKFLDSIDLISLVQEYGIKGFRKIGQFLKAANFFKKEGQVVDELVDITHAGTRKYFDNLLQEQHDLQKVYNADMLNKILSDTLGYEPAFRLQSLAFEFKTVADDRWVRVYVPGVNRMDGAFIMRFDDIVGLSPLQIKNRFNLPNVPTHIVDVHVGQGKTIWKGEVGKNSFGQEEGATQYMLRSLLDKDSFKNPRPLPEIIK